MAKRKIGKPLTRAPGKSNPEINDRDRVEYVGEVFGPADPQPGWRGLAFTREACGCCVLVIFDGAVGLPRQVAKGWLRRLNVLELMAEAANR